MQKEKRVKKRVPQEKKIPSLCVFFANPRKKKLKKKKILSLCLLSLVYFLLSLVYFLLVYFLLSLVYFDFY